MDVFEMPVEKSQREYKSFKVQSIQSKFSKSNNNGLSENIEMTERSEEDATGVPMPSAAASFLQVPSPRVCEGNRHLGTKIRCPMNACKNTICENCCRLTFSGGQER